MLEDGTPLSVVMSLCGHLSARMTRHYTHIGTGAKEAAVARLSTGLFDAEADAKATTQ